MWGADMSDADTVIIGAGPAGLACAAVLKMKGCDSLILEAGDKVGMAWRHHYDRLHLHTHRKHSGLPGLPMPKTYDKYPAREQVVSYLEAYAQYHDLQIQFETTVSTVRHDDYWMVETNHGPFRARNVIFATGMATTPHIPTWPGYETFPGEVIHSNTYKNPKAFQGQKVLVVGFGNSGGEIAMDLADAGNETWLAVKGVVNVIPRDLLGIPILSFSITQQWMPYKLVDTLNKPIMRLVIGDLSAYGLPKSDKGPMAQIIEDGRIPLLNIGTLERIKSGHIRVCRGLDRIDGQKIYFSDGAAEEFDAIILATGYRVDLRSMLSDHHNVLDENGAPLVSGGPTTAQGLYFCSYKPSPTGQIREMGIEARRIADIIIGAGQYLK